MALPIFPQEENIVDKLNRGLGTGLSDGIQQLAQSNLDRMIGKNNYFQQNLSNVLKDLETKPQPLLQQLQPTQQQVPEERAPQQTSPVIEEPSKPLSHAQKIKREELELRTSKESRNWLNDYRNKAHEASTLKSDLKMMSKAARSGKLYSGITQRLAEKLGFPELTTNNASQIFDKLASEVRLHVAKVALPKGSKITNMIEQLSGKTVPGREMDIPAIVALSDAGEVLMELAELEYQEADKKLSEWNGKLPYNADSQVDKSLAKRKKELRKEAEKALYMGIKGEIPIKEIEAGSSFDSLEEIPTRGLPIGKKIRENELGKIYEWTGKKWKEING